MLMEGATIRTIIETMEIIKEINAHEYTPVCGRKTRENETKYFSHSMKLEMLTGNPRLKEIRADEISNKNAF